MSKSLFPRLHACLMLADPDAKRAAVAALRRAWQAGELVRREATPPEPIDEPGRPARPLLVTPDQVRRRSPATPEGRAALIHALAHIEFNAINLALDAAYRFRDLPVGFQDDWLRVADEEAGHFALLRDHMRDLGFEYGDFEAHDGLWRMAARTAHDPLVRMALIPRLLEARGLDAAPVLMAKLSAWGDSRAVEILAVIQHDEIQHVRIGNYWYGELCRQRDLDPVRTFRALVREYRAPHPRPPFDTRARLAAGFGADEIADLAQW